MLHRYNYGLILIDSLAVKIDEISELDAETIDAFIEKSFDVEHLVTLCSEEEALKLKSIAKILQEEEKEGDMDARHIFDN